MKISRHARSRMKLYKIDADDLMMTIAKPDFVENEDLNCTALRTFPGKYGDYPLKVVYDTGKELVVTVYPLKRKNWSKT